MRISRQDPSVRSAGIWGTVHGHTAREAGMGSRMSDYCRNTYPEQLRQPSFNPFDDEIFLDLHPPRGPCAFGH